MLVLYLVSGSLLLNQAITCVFTDLPFIQILSESFTFFPEIKLNSDDLTQISDSLCFGFGRDFYIKVLFWWTNSVVFFLYSDFFPTFIQILCRIKVAGLNL